MDDVKIVNIDKDKNVFFSDGTKIDYDGFIECFRGFLNKRVAGETLVPADMERFMHRTSAKNLKHLMDGKKQEGFMEAVQNKMLTPRQKMALGGLVTIIVVMSIAVVILKSGKVF